MTFLYFVYSDCFRCFSESGSTLPLTVDPSESSHGAIDMEGGATESVLKVCKISCLIHSGMVSSFNGSCKGFPCYVQQGVFVGDDLLQRVLMYHTFGVFSTDYSRMQLVTLACGVALRITCGFRHIATSSPALLLSFILNGYATWPWYDYLRNDLTHCPECTYHPSFLLYIPVQDPQGDVGTNSRHSFLDMVTSLEVRMANVLFSCKSCNNKLV